jgi:tRNA modification GTPase
MVSAGVEDLGGRVAISNRHHRALAVAAEELEAAEMEQPEVAAEAVRSVLDRVRSLTGEVVTEDVLDRIFSSFCIGK